MLETLPGDWIGVGTAAARVSQFVEQAAQTDAAATILGEPGTGKQLIAKLIHERSPRNKMPFLMVDCSLYFERELKRELFGYATGSSRGKSRKGLLEFASLGTCYLSHIEELSSGLQAYLLAFLKDRHFARLGDGKKISSCVRLIVSSDKNLEGLVGAGLFDKGLFTDLSRLSSAVPSLRDRRDDIPALVAHLSSAYAAERRLEEHPAFSSEALQALQAFPWPRNVDDLRAEVFRVLDNGHRSVRPDHLGMEISSYWLGQRGDPEIRKVLEELDAHIREFRVLCRLDLGYVELLDAAGGTGFELAASNRELPGDELT